jgi:hypothetical protein
MIYDFLAKIRNVSDPSILTEETLAALIMEINSKFATTLEIRFILKDADNTGEILVKSSASVSSMLALHDKELEVTIAAFKDYLTEIAQAIGGQISENDGFYNNSKTFKKLFS